MFGVAAVSYYPSRRGVIIDNSDLFEVKESFARCRVQDRFWSELYKTITDDSASIARMLGGDDFAALKQRSQEYMDLIFLYVQNPESGTVDKQLRDLGNRIFDFKDRMRIRDDVYTVWKDAFIKTIERQDDQYNERLAGLWDDVLSAIVAFYHDNRY